MNSTTWKSVAWAVLGAAMAAGGPLAMAENSSPPPQGGLRHAVYCPPFKGPAELAGLYHKTLLGMLEKADGIELVSVAKPVRRRAPGYFYQIQGAILKDEDGQSFVSVSLLDGARREPIASHMAPATGKPTALAAWRRTLEDSIRRRVAKMPFECRLRRQRGQNSYTLDRGLSAGLRPGMVLDVAREEEALISPVTGEIVGRESFQPVGRVEIFRVMDHAAYARPLPGSSIPRTGRLLARNF